MNLDILSIFLTVQKYFFVALSFLYLIFSIIIVKQIAVMARDIKDKLNPIIVSFSYIQLAFSICVIFLTLLWL
jgi:hypothetical protein